MRLFDELNIETQSTCNRRCPTCLRESYPNREALAGRAEKHQMESELVYSLLDQAVALGFREWVCLQHFNEPLQDPRIAEFGRYARGKFRGIVIHTNGDYLNEAKAKELDGAFDLIRIALYGGNKPRRAAQYADWFHDTQLDFTNGDHITTHYSPKSDLQARLNVLALEPCERECQMRCIIGYDGRMMLCCDDIGAEFDLGDAHDTPLEELWFGERHQQILETLSRPGGRQKFPYCSICPRVSPPYWSIDATSAYPIAEQQ